MVCPDNYVFNKTKWCSCLRRYFFSVDFILLLLLLLLPCLPFSRCELSPALLGVRFRTVGRPALAIREVWAWRVVTGCRTRAHALLCISLRLPVERKPRAAPLHHRDRLCSRVERLLWSPRLLSDSPGQSLSETWEADGGLSLSSTSSSDGRRVSAGEVCTYTRSLF